MATNILIVGMNRIGASIGLILKKSSDLVNRIGYDPEVANMKTSVKMGALDQSVEILSNGVNQADVIIYTHSAGKMIDVLNSIRRDIKPGSILIDTNPIGHETFPKVREVLTDPASFITWVPAINPDYLDVQDGSLATAKADLFNAANVFIAASMDTHPKALKAGDDLAVLAGAMPLHIEPDELAGISALSHDFPCLMAAVIASITTSEPGWNEARKLAGPDYSKVTSGLRAYEHEDIPEEILYSNRKNLKRLISSMIEELQQLQMELDEEKNKQLGMFIKNTILGRQLWQKQRTELSWLEKGPINPDAPHSMRELMFGVHRRKKNK